MTYLMSQWTNFCVRWALTELCPKFVHVLVRTTLGSVQAEFALLMVQFYHPWAECERLWTTVDRGPKFWAAGRRPEVSKRNADPQLYTTVDQVSASHNKLVTSIGQVCFFENRVWKSIDRALRIH